MDLTEHTSIAKDMIGKLPVLDDNARASLVNALSHDALTRADVTQIRIGLRSLTMMTPEGEKEKSASDKVLLGLLMKLPEEPPEEIPPPAVSKKKQRAEDVLLGQQQLRCPKRQKRGTKEKQGTRKRIANERIGESANEPPIFANSPIFQLLIQVACKDAQAKRLPLEFWVKLADAIERGMLDVL